MPEYNKEVLERNFQLQKDTGIFLDKAILTISSLFLGFLFTQIPNYKINSDISYFLLVFTICAISLAIISVVLSCHETGKQFNIGMDYIEENITLNKYINFQKASNKRQQIFYKISIISFISSVILVSIFYILYVPVI